MGLVGLRYRNSLTSLARALRCRSRLTREWTRVRFERRLKVYHNCHSSSIRLHLTCFEGSIETENCCFFKTVNSVIDVVANQCGVGGALDVVTVEFCFRTINAIVSIH
jgi:hypothetical protein